MAYVPDSGSVLAYQGTTPWSIGSIYGNISGSVVAQVSNFPSNSSVSGTVNVANNSSVIAFQLAGSVLATSATLTPVANQSVSGTVAVSNFPANQSVSGTVVVAFPTTQNVSGSVVAVVTNNVTVVSSIAGGIFPISGSVAATVTNFPTTQNVSGSVVASGTVTANIGTIPGSVVAFQGTSPFVVNFQNPSIIAMQLAGSVMATSATVSMSNSSVMLLNSANTIGSVAAIVSNFPTTQNVSGSIAGTYTEPAVATSVTGLAVMFKTNVSTSTMGVVSTTNPLPVQGSVTAMQGTNPYIFTGSVQGTMSVLGTVPVTQSGAWVSSISGTVDVNNGSVVAYQGTSPWIVAPNNSSIFAVSVGSVLAVNRVTRNDTVASFLGADLTTRYQASDSAGRVLTKPMAPEESRIEGYISLTSTSVTTLVAAAGAGLRNYITDIWLANTGATTTLVTFKDGAGSVLGYTIAPTVSGSNLPGLVTPIRTGANTTFDIQAGSNTSTLYATVKGFRAP